MNNTGTNKSLNWIIALMGVWELISPWVLGYSALTSAMLAAVIVGALLIIFGMWAALSRSAARVLDWLNALLGLWLIIAPFVLAFTALTPAGEISSIIVGVVVLILGVWAAVAAGRGIRTPEMAAGTMAGTVPVTGSGSSSMDDQIQNRVMDRWMQDPKVDVSGINVSVNNGTVMLKGSVHSTEERRLAENDAESVAGVQGVDDNLEVE